MSPNAGGDDNNKSILTYDTEWPVYGMSWCGYDNAPDKQRILISSFREDYKNYIQVRKHESHELNRF